MTTLCFIDGGNTLTTVSEFFNLLTVFDFSTIELPLLSVEELRMLVPIDLLNRWSILPDFSFTMFSMLRVLLFRFG